VLDSYYEIEQDGRKYFGNVTLTEFHQFERDGEHYLFNVATMTPYRLSEPVARLVDRVSSPFSATLLPERAMEELKKLGLVAGLDRPTAPAPEPAANATEPTEPAEPAGGKSDIGRFVDAISLFVAQQCNMACVYCYGQGGEYAEKGMMSAATAFKAVDWLMENSGGIETVGISFFGGEPMMNFPLIKKVVKYAKQAAEKRGKKVNFGITTNGSLLTDQRIAFLKEENIRPVISFDGPAEIQNRQRPFSNGKGSHAKVYANIQKLRKVFPRVSARATLHGDADPAEIRAGLEQAGFKSFGIIKAADVILDGIPADAPSQDQSGERMLAMEADMGRELVRDIKARKVGWAAKNGKVGFFVGRMMSGAKRHVYCGVGRRMAAITASGDLYPCHRFAGQEDMKLGNVDSYRLDGGINDYHRAVVDNLPECQRCWARYACGGGCFYEGKATRGDIHLPDPAHCQQTKTMMEMAIPLYCQLDDADKDYVRGSLKTRLEDQI